MCMHFKAIFIYSIYYNFIQLCLLWHSLNWADGHVTCTCISLSYYSSFIKKYNLVLNISCFLIINKKPLPPPCISITTIHTSWHYLTRCYSSNLKTTIEKRLTFDNAMSFTAWQIIPRNKVLVQGLLQKLCEVDGSCFLVV